MKIRNFFYSIVAATIVGFVAGPAMAQQYSGNSPNYLYSQYYTQPGVSAATAAMYPAPHPVPHHVGHTYYTYQALMPHEMMYSHSRRTYHTYAGPGAFYGGECNQGGGGVTKTCIKWHSGANHMGHIPGLWSPFGKLQARIAAHHNRAPQYGGCPTGECSGN